jgi:glycosyltransferase involved in cell wall biosynthesis
MQSLRVKILKALYKLSPFSLKGDLTFEKDDINVSISCVINFYGRINLLEGILYSLASQNLPKEDFEVILIEDRGGTKEGKIIAEKLSDRLNIKYYALSENFGVMGYSRNFGLSKAKGEFVLFLDDDTVIIQNDFLSKLLRIFRTTNADAIIPHGNASFVLIKGRYDFHDPYYPTNRCMAYRRNVLKELGGFVSEIIGQEDVEFVIRYISSGKTFIQSKEIEYYHPPLIINKISKAAAVGMSFAKLKKRYPFIIWLMLILNGLRYLPLLLLPLKTKWKMQGKFSLGFLIGILYGFIGKNVGYG